MDSGKWSNLESMGVKMAWQVGQIVRLHLTRVADFLFPQDTFAEDLLYSGYLKCLLME